ncbi:MAG: hypothetical protein K2J20_06150 [Bacilli bacterium]|nr:hypothetical protein [Bacilli bacterium]
MNDNKAKEIVDKIFKEIFGEDNPYSIDDIRDKFAFDIRIPIEVRDTTTNEITYTSCINAKSFIKNENMEKRDATEGWMIPKVQVKNLQDILNIWNSINYTTTERIYDSDNVFGSDPIYRSNNVYRSTDCGDSSNLIFCDGIQQSSYVIASQRSVNLNYCLRVDDSNTCTNSYNVICSAKISNSLFIQDCSNLYECIFCSHISNKEYCIANMQFSEEEYFYLKGEIIKWILSSN